MSCVGEKQMELGQDHSKLRYWFLAATSLRVLSQRFSFDLIKGRSNVVTLMAMWRRRTVFMVYTNTAQMRLSGSVLGVRHGGKLRHED
jgi:hypothetical protein